MAHDAGTDWLTQCELTLLIDGEPWRRLADADQLGRAGPTEPVYVLDSESAVLHFGDGEHGRRPPVGASLRGRYRNGSGKAGNVEGTWLSASTAVLRLARKPAWIAWRWLLAALLLLGLAWWAWRVTAQ